ncbi:MAG: S1/P1 Nuclease [Proteobacteria bacterium]|nr:S1/P1 Nuclease [Pseudomonadota bacterium]
MKTSVRLVAGLVAALSAQAAATQALAWGNTGHRLIGRLAIQKLPADVPAFLRTPLTVSKVGELAREPDRWKGAGKTHDNDLDPGHFLDLGDDGKVFGGPALDALPLTRADYEAALKAVGADSWKAGYLPYSIVEGWQQLAIDFAYWRVDRAGARATRNAAHRAWFLADAAEREQLILRDIGTLAHYVGDGSQPLHVTVHYNGWGSGPNPNGYTQDKVHGPFEGAFVHDYVKPAAVAARVAAFHDCNCSIDRRTAGYLAATAATVEPFYQLYKAGGFAGGDARGVTFAMDRLAAGAGELRDEIVLAWRASANASVGWPAAKVADVEAGRVDPYDSLVGLD